MLRRIFFSLLLLLICLFTSSLSALAAPDVSARACVVIEAESGRVLYQKNAQERLPMASTTKIITALVALEQGNREDVVKISSSAAGTEGSSMYLESGETMTLEELLYGLMLASGNDAAVAIAEHFGGIDAFVTLMNEKAEQIGAKNSHFSNPNGLPDESHYSTAADMAKITAYALKNPDFARIVATKSYRIAGEGKAYPRSLTNHNKLLSMYDGCIGVKTGFTKVAGRCLVSAAKRNNMTLICVTLNAPNDWNDHSNLYDHLFDTYQIEEYVYVETILGEIPVSGSDILTLPFAALESFSYPLCEGETLTGKFTLPESVAAPIEAGMQCGQLEVQLGTTTVKTLPLVVKGDAKKQWIPETIKRGFRLNLGTLYWSWLTLLHF